MGQGADIPSNSKYYIDHETQNIKDTHTRLQKAYEFIVKADRHSSYANDQLIQAGLNQARLGISTAIGLLEGRLASLNDPNRLV